VAEFFLSIAACSILNSAKTHDSANQFLYVLFAAEGFRCGFPLSTRQIASRLILTPSFGGQRPKAKGKSDSADRCSFLTTDYILFWTSDSIQVQRICGLLISILTHDRDTESGNRSSPTRRPSSHPATAVSCSNTSIYTFDYPPEFPCVACDHTDGLAGDRRFFGNIEKFSFCYLNLKWMNVGRC